ncbi:hypothetical protein KO494_05715 [Lacinutrix sp. C3R15]|uniref:hypothetical protein n=1 Tax=Flavobacteriaceae TaxID=49546 RepID=UPI001C092086|nr:MULTISPECIES: hypothetical protein [Flavobacteriaceae]MBU2939034.1 hypothetical protein [Lacinutrix sp. C3R15]MDO6622349.1 hypothetical protein [Oceanihabitans sp. 1_MG-2023]
MNLIDDVLHKLSLILLITNSVLFTYSSFKLKIKAIKYFAIYLVIVFFVLTSSILIISFYKELHIKQNNLFLSHFYFIFQFVFLSLFYRELFTTKQKNWVNLTFILVAFVLGVQYINNISLFYKFNLLEILITSFPLVIYSIIHLYNSLGKTGKYMYINAAILIYLSVSTLIFILGNLINTVDKSLSINVWLLNKVLYVGYLTVILIEWKKSLWKTKN